MNKPIQSAVKRATGASSVTKEHDLQKLWGGYGLISRYSLKGCGIPSIIVKHVSVPAGDSHGFRNENEFSHNRKMKSYKVEAEWYRNYSRDCNEKCRVPHCFEVSVSKNEFLFILEDLDASGFPGRRSMPGLKEITAGLEWLAAFHSVFMERAPENLWKNGTYWHLDTRPEELARLNDSGLKKAAPLIDLELKKCRYKTLLHGDAKIENFCFSDDGKKTAAIDFQYTGGGCGMKDVAYFIASCIDEKECGAMEEALLDIYFSSLRENLQAHRPEIDLTAAEKEWRGLYHTAWADFHRFLKGWTSGYWDSGSYSEKITRVIINRFIAD